MQAELAGYIQRSNKVGVSRVWGFAFAGFKPHDAERCSQQILDPRVLRRYSRSLSATVKRNEVLSAMWEARGMGSCRNNIPDDKFQSGSMNDQGRTHLQKSAQYM